MPPMEPPTTHSSFFDTKMVDEQFLGIHHIPDRYYGKLQNRMEVRSCGLIEAGPVEPLHPPRTFTQMTKYLLVSNALPGPIMLSHQPGLPSSSSWYPAAWASPENA